MEEKIKLELTSNEFNLVLAGVAKLPLEVSMDIFIKLRTTAAEQMSKEKPTEE